MTLRYSERNLLLAVQEGKQITEAELRYMLDRLERVRADCDRYREALQHAIDVLGPGDDEPSDSPANMAFAILMHALGGGVVEPIAHVAPSPRNAHSEPS